MKLLLSYPHFHRGGNSGRVTARSLTADSDSAWFQRSIVFRGLFWFTTFPSPSRPSFAGGEDKLELPLEVTLFNSRSSPNGITWEERQPFPSPPLDGSGGQTKAQPPTPPFILKIIYWCVLRSYSVHSHSPWMLLRQLLGQYSFASLGPGILTFEDGHLHSVHPKKLMGESVFYQKHGLENSPIWPQQSGLPRQLRR